MFGITRNSEAEHRAIRAETAATFLAAKAEAAALLSAEVIGKLAFAEAEVARLSRRTRERRRDATDVSRAIAAKAAALTKRFAKLDEAQIRAAIEAGKGRR